MDASSNPVEVLKDERKRIDLFHLFWDRRSVGSGRSVWAHSIDMTVPLRINIESN